MRGRGYVDRRDAGRRLARELAGRIPPDAVVLGLARGGVPVAAEVARATGRPLDALVVRKLGVPGHEELAMGAIAGDGTRVLNPAVLQALPDPARAVAGVAAREHRELRRREAAYRAGRPALPVDGRTVVLVDDGLATGASMRVAVRAVRERGARAVLVAVPVGAPDACAALEDEAEALVCPLRPTPLRGVGAWYRDFAQTTDDEVRALLTASGDTSVPPDG